jgi:hypothetical protein
MNKDALKARRDELLIVKNRAYDEWQQCLGAIAVLDEFIEKEEDENE